jgi:EAL domain-containing protein (putative c-di-GMP-specific phosphodiesterase class I)
VYEDITRIVLREAAEMLRVVNADVSVNIALADIVRPGFIDEVIRCAESVRDCPGSLILEILETEDICEVRSCLNFIGIARSVGCKIAIDDFGSGYSNFTCLLDVPVDIVKIDGTH